MKYTLIDFQEKAVDAIVRRLRQARGNYAEDGDLTAIGLTAPTGTGKTVMATAVLERLLFGDDDNDPNRDLVVIWFSDDPNLNLQTKHKFTLASSKITANRIVELAGVDQRVLDGGTIYLAHMQQFGIGATTSHAVNKGVTNDGRTHGVWDMIGNTVRAKGKDVLLVIDEAHRGAGEGTAARKTIINTLVHGGKSGVGVTVPATPVVFGLSATPARFTESMAGAGRTLTPVGVDMAKVLASGIIKDAINVPRPVENQKADHTLLADAVGELRKATDRWQTHHEETGDPLVVPIMVVQVPPGVTKVDMDAYVDTVHKSWPGLFQDKTMAHAFDSHVDEKHGDHTLRYVAPADIANDETLRVVFFKNALTTGWDCPRAEVMVSLRSSTDPTPIAQLIGRMVRTPLAKRIEDGDPDLNSVFLHLPLYDAKQVASVVTALTSDPDLENGPTINVGSVDCLPAAGSEKFVEALAALPSFERPAKPHGSVMAAASSLAGLLADHQFEAKPTDNLKARVVAAMSQAHRENDETVGVKAHDVLHYDMGTDTLVSTESGYATTGETGQLRSLRVREIDVRSNYKDAKKAFTEEYAQAYVNHLIEAGEEPIDADALVIALASVPAATAAVEKAAADQIGEWRAKHEGKVDRLNVEARGKFAACWSPNLDLMETTVLPPEKVKAATGQIVTGDDGEKTIVDLPSRDKHLFADPATGRFPGKPGTTWEEEALDIELGRDGTKFWYRNPSRGKNALAIPYDDGDGRGLMHPDFLIFRTDDAGVPVVDIIDPHLHSAADTGPKWRGLALWAAANVDRLGVVEAVIKVDDQLRTVNLLDSNVVAAFEDVSTKDGVEAVFASHGRDLS